jgi:hypothetical protein
MCRVCGGSQIELYSNEDGSVLILCQDCEAAWTEGG